MTIVVFPVNSLGLTMILLLNQMVEKASAGDNFKSIVFTFQRSDK